MNIFKTNKKTNNKRKYNLPKYVSWDIRNTALNNTVWFNVSLKKDGRITSTKTKTVKAAMEAVAQNRLDEGIWTKFQAKEYMAAYTPKFERGWSVELAKKTAKSGPRESKKKVVNTSISAKNKRLYDLPKYVCYDKAESRNREKNVFQTQLKVNGKLIKNNLYTVKDAVIYNVSKMLEHTDIWSLNDIADYLKTYKPDMENGNFIPSNTPKSPSWRKREKKKNIQLIKDQINTKLAKVLKFAKDNDININVSIK